MHCFEIVRPSVYEHKLKGGGVKKEARGIVEKTGEIKGDLKKKEEKRKKGRRRRLKRNGGREGKGA